MKAWMAMIVLLLIVLTRPTPSSGETYYISPGGLDTNSGLSASFPWKTFTHAIPELQPGDTLILLDGVYSVVAGTGLPAITYGVNANNGTEGQPITIRAENERGALLESTGDWNQAFYMNGCSYWNVIGLRGKSADLAEGDGGKPYSVFTITKSDHIVLKRLLATHPNRYGNSQAIQVSESSYSLVEECEAYYFHRHGISIYRSDHITVRRCYVNSRGYADIPGGCPSHAGAEDRGDEGMTLYQTTDSIVENCISEGNEFFGNSGQRNYYLGSISLNNLWGFAVGHHCCDDYMEATDNIYVNNVAVGSQYHGFLTQSDVNVFVDHLTSINSIDYYGLYSNNKYSDNRSDDPVVTWMVSPSLTVQNSLFLNNNTYGIRVNEDHTEDYTYRKFEYLNSYGHGQNYGPGLDPVKPEDVVEALSEVDPQMGSCIVFIPGSSPMKGAGKTGADIGANVLYRYEDGILTDQPLWDPVTGAFPCGAIVPGLNDVPGSSCFDVHERLNVNANGCILELDLSLSTTLISDFGGGGIWEYDGSAWNRLTASNPESMANYENKLVGDFGVGGLWEFDGSSWTKLTSSDADSIGSCMVAYGASLAVDFGVGGIWEYDSSAWSRLTGSDPEYMATHDNKLVGDFGTGGMWEFDGTSWTKLSTSDADNSGNCMVAYGTSLVIDFGGGGIWDYDGSSWSRLTGSDPEYMATYDNKLVGDFGLGGLWEFDGISWNKLTSSDADNSGSCMVAYGSSLVVDFGAGGIWEYDGSSWTELTSSNPEHLCVYDGKLVGDFGTGGMWEFDGTSWFKLTPSDADNSGNCMVAIDFQ